MFYIIGLGNPGAEYQNTRHNTGRITAEAFRRLSGFPDWQADKKIKALISVGKIGKTPVSVVLPETFMNKSGETLKRLKDLRLKKVGKGKNTKIEINNLVVVHDDLDIPFGRMKISFNKSSGGHRGVLSVIRSVRTEGFVRVRIGISGLTAKGMIKKPTGEEAVGKFILERFKPLELKALQKLAARAAEALTIIIADGYHKAMVTHNQG
jgi:PTH1 family peptidyl-tRNA hydrolase